MPPEIQKVETPREVTAADVKRWANKIRASLFNPEIGFATDNAKKDFNTLGRVIAICEGR
jgi:hypothetical protein